MNERKQINFTIVPDDDKTVSRTYANFCAISHTPFDFTLTFCEVLPLSEDDVRHAESEHTVRAPVRAKVVLPLPVLSALIGALQEHARVLQESSAPAWPKGPVH
jgi:hypothetical protein